MSEANDINKKQLENDLYGKGEEGLSWNEKEVIKFLLYSLADLLAEKIAERVVEKLRGVYTPNITDSMLERGNINERLSTNYLYEGSEEKLTRLEAELILSFIALAREKGSPYVTYRELARYSDKSHDIVRAYLKRLKKKGEVIDVCVEYMMKSGTGSFFTKIGEKAITDQEYSSLCPKGEIEKTWRLVRLNPLNDREVIRYLKEERPEIIYYVQMMMSKSSGRAISQEEVERNIYRLLGIKIGNEGQSNYMDKK